MIEAGNAEKLRTPPDRDDLEFNDSYPTFDAGNDETSFLVCATPVMACKSEGKHDRDYTSAYESLRKMICGVCLPRPPARIRAGCGSLGQSMESPTIRVRVWFDGGLKSLMSLVGLISDFPM